MFVHHVTVYGHITNKIYHSLVYKLHNLLGCVNHRRIVKTHHSSCNPLFMFKILMITKLYYVSLTPPLPCPLFFFDNPVTCFQIIHNFITNSIHRGTLFLRRGFDYREIFIYMYTGCPRRNGQNFGRVFLMLNYADIIQNTYIQS